MKTQIFTLTAMIALSMFSFRAVAQTKADSVAISARIEKSLQKLDADVQLTAEQAKELKPIFFQKEQVRIKMKATDPTSEAFSKLQSNYQELKLKIQMVLTDEQQNKLEEKKKEKIDAVTKGKK